MNEQMSMHATQPKASSLPSRSRLTWILIVMAMTFAAFEASTFQLELFSASEKLRMVRIGIMLGYASALIAGLDFYWDDKAARIIGLSTTSMNKASWHIKLLQDDGGARHQEQIQREQERINIADQEIQIATTYQNSKAWLKYLAFAGLILSVTLQLLGSTGS
ncbi:hypothetical protein [Comamonas thiooxydans]|uniref:hypothetical protein n=1 Tax=Comamonas thiooxydans TaxID=363952 RepID=UPI00211449C4|nr:hypothetical protein [Comamonas thiooxydans]UUE95077.1 hypothetical protein MJ608_05350 [Comamonas thiooxydans]